MIQLSILIPKVTNRALVEDKENNNDIFIHSQIEYDNDKDYACVKEKVKKRPTEATEELKKRKMPRRI